MKKFCGFFLLLAGLALNANALDAIPQNSVVEKMPGELYLNCQPIGFDPIQHAQAIIETDEADALCRMTCSIVVVSEYGAVGFSATSGGLFTSCEKAFENACMKASRNALLAMFDSSPDYSLP